jgi:nucleoside-diphosphate-sugar epimerase
MVDGIYRLMYSNITSPVNIGDPTYYSVNDLVKIVADVAGKKITTKSIPGPVGVQSRNFSNNRIYETGWKPSFKLRDGIKETYSWILNQVQNAQS